MFATIKPDQEAEFEEAFATVRSRVAGTPGHRFDELLREEDEPGADEPRLGGLAQARHRGRRPRRAGPGGSRTGE
jgi:hypothetical protein